MRTIQDKALASLGFSIRKEWKRDDKTRFDVIDAFASPSKVESLDDLHIDYDFRPARNNAAKPGAQWEYKVATFADVSKLGKGDFAIGLNRLGDDRWELVSIENGSRCLFKRPK